MGADDVIVLLENKGVLIQRFESQITGTRVFYETADYFGLDRRWMEMDTLDGRRVGLATRVTISCARPTPASKSSSTKSSQRRSVRCWTSPDAD